MAIRADSYASVAEVLAFTRHLLDGQSNFNSTTRPTLTEVEKFIDRCSGILNIALSAGGFAPSAITANSTAKLSCDDYVATRGSEYVEVTQRGVGFSGDEGSRTTVLHRLHGDAADFVKLMGAGFSNLSISRSVAMSRGLTFTGMDAESERADPDDSTKEQPKFTRNLFDNRTGRAANDQWDEDN